MILSAPCKYDATTEDCYYGGVPLVESQIPTAMVPNLFFICHQ